MPHDANAHLDTAPAPGGELGGTWASPTVDATHSGSAHHTEDHDHDGTPTQKLLAANSHESPSADTHHAKVHGDAEHPAMGQMKVVRKTADETISLNQVSQDDDHLFFAVGANEVWVFSALIVFNSGATEDFKYQFAGPAGSSGLFVRLDITSTPTALGTDSANITQSSGVDVGLPVMGTIENGGTAGNLQLKWAQFLSGVTNCVVREHSYLLAHRVA